MPSRASQLSRVEEQQTIEPPSVGGAPTETPFAMNSYRAAQRAFHVSDVKKALEDEIGDPHEGGDAFSRSAFPHLQTPDWIKKINDFVEDPTLYDHDTRRWKNIPVETKLEKVLYDPFCAIINAVISKFGLSNRVARNTSKTYAHHKNADDESLPTEELGDNILEQLQTEANARLKSSPDIMILSKGGQCFELEDFPQATDARQTYKACGTPLDMKTDSNLARKQHMLQIGLYSRECFSWQENRIFAHSAIITQSTIQLYHFNRARVIRSSKVNYHENPKTFIRMITGLIGSDDTSLGFDPSFSWKKTDEGRVRVVKVKVGMSEDSTSPHRDARVIQDIWSTNEVCGRATRCWTVKIDLDNIPTDAVVKDIWISEGRVKEWEFLKEIERTDLKGVVRTLSYEVLGTALSHESIKDIFYPETSNLLLIDRTWCRFVFEGYGLPLEYAKTPVELIAAFLDAVCGHRGLWMIGILHRDVSENNVLLGKKGALIGNRGILIDLDMAIFTNRTESSKTDKRTGTRLFQSMNILKGGGYPHSHLDDLESYFNLLLLIFLKWNGLGSLNQNLPSFLEHWSSPDATHAYFCKHTILSLFQTEVLDHISDAWPEAVKALLGNLRDFVWKHAHTKRPSPAPDAKTVAEFNPNAAEHYDEFIGYIEQALAELTATPAPSNSSPPMAASSSTPPDPTSPTPWSRSAATNDLSPYHGGPSTPMPSLAQKRANKAALSPLCTLPCFPFRTTSSRGEKRTTLHEQDDEPKTPVKRTKLSNTSGVSPTRSSDGDHSPSFTRRFNTPSPRVLSPVDDKASLAGDSNPISPSGEQDGQSDLSRSRSPTRGTGLARRKSLDHIRHSQSHV